MWRWRQRLELINAYLEVFDARARDDEFAHGAKALRELERAGVPVDSIPNHPWVERALPLLP